MKHLNYLVFFLLFTCSLQHVDAQEISEVCRICNGGGSFKCPLCNGKGKWKTSVNGKSQKITCPACNSLETRPCYACNGTGKDEHICKPQTQTSHPDGYRWLWCKPCNHTGIAACTRCGGIGNVYAEGGESSTCPLCEGKKYTLCQSCKGDCGWYVEELRCETCEGNGVVACAKCDGQGWIPPADVEKAYAKVCKECHGNGEVPHRDCSGKGCKKCKNGNVRCRKCDGYGAVIASIPTPEFKPCYSCNREGIQKCTVCGGTGHKLITQSGIVIN